MIFAITLFVSAYAETGNDCIWIKHINGTYSCVMLDTNPQFVFDGDVVTIDSKKFRVDDILSYRFGNSDVTSNIDMESDENYIVFNDEFIEIKNMKNGIRDIKIFDSEGKLVKNIESNDATNDIRIGIGDLNGGIYLLNVSGATFKFFKR